MPRERKELVDAEEEEVILVSSLPEAVEHRRTFERSLQEREAPLAGAVYHPEGSAFGRLEVAGGLFPLTELCMRQLGRHLPHFSMGMFMQASMPLRKLMVEEFITYVETEVPFKYLLMEQGSEAAVMRGVVPSSRVTIPDSTILEALLETFGEDHSRVVLFNAPGLDDPKHVRVRVIRDEGLEGLDEELYPAVDITTSSLGWGPITLRYCIYRKVCENGLFLPFPDTDGPYFAHDYTGMGKDDFLDVFRRASANFRGQDEHVIEAIRRLREVQMDVATVEESYRRLQMNEDLGKGVVQRAFASLGKDLQPMTRWEWINSVTKAAQSYRDELRLKYEVAMGAYVPLQLQHDEEAGT